MTEHSAPKGIKDIAQGRSDLYRVSPYDLNVREGWNSRDASDPDNIEHIDQLAKSIAEVGVKESLTVKFDDGKLWLTDGHCRRAAAIRAIEKYGAPKDMLLPVKTEGKDATEADMVFSQIVRNSGKPLTPFEQGKVFLRLLGLGWEKNNIAVKSGFSKKHVDNLIALHEAPEEMKDSIRKGEVSATMATQAIHKNRGDVDAAAKDVGEAVKKAKSEGKAKATAKDLPKKPTTPPKRKVKVKPIDPKKAVRELKTIISSYEVTDPDNLDVPDGDIVLVPMTSNEYARVRELLGLKPMKRDSSDII